MTVASASGLEALDFGCPTCGDPCRARVADVGRAARCPGCRSRYRVPAPWVAPPTVAGGEPEAVPRVVRAAGGGLVRTGGLAAIAALGAFGLSAAGAVGPALAAAVAAAVVAVTVSPAALARARLRPRSCLETRFGQRTPPARWHRSELPNRTYSGRTSSILISIQRLLTNGRKRIR